MFSFSSFFSLNRSKSDIKIKRFIIKRFGYRPKNLSYFLQAITHKSLSNNTISESSNERLEFLGDAVIENIIVSYLYRRYPDQREGFLSTMKMNLDR